MAEQAEKKQFDPATMFAEWMKQMGGVWNQAGLWTRMMQMPGVFPEMPDKGAASKAGKAFLSSSKIAMALAQKLGEPENMEAFLKAMDTLPEVSLSMGQQIVGTYLEMQKMWTDQMAKMDRHKEAYNFEGVDENFFRMWQDIYQKEFKRYFNIPTLGLIRFQQERQNRFLDECNNFQLALSEFLYLFSVPVEKSAQVMREKTEEMAEKGEIPDNFKDFYNMWVKVLEGHYMTLLQSEEYVAAMSKTIEALVRYIQAKEDFFEDMLAVVPVPTNKEMDELYKEFYELKRKVRDMSKRLDRYEKQDAAKSKGGAS